MGEREALVALRLVAYMVYTDITQIEQRHAAIRRRLVVMQSTNVPSGSDLASHVALRSYRHQRKKKSAHKQQMTKKATPVRSPRKRKFLKGAGGPWRAYVRRESLGKKGKVNIVRLAAAYRTLTADELQKLRAAVRFRFARR